MLDFLGISNIEELYEDVPDHLRMKRPLKTPTGHSELDLFRELSKLAGNNRQLDKISCFLPGNHWVPAAIDVVKRGEFLTSYTPYSPEISQGMLQGLFEYQSLVCALTGMDVANSSMYDWATSVGEAARMASRITRRNKVIIAQSIDPARISVVKTYCEGPNIEIDVIPFDHETGELSIPLLQEKLSKDTAGVYIENPNVFGIIESQIEEITDKIHSVGALSIVGVDPFSLAIIEAPASYGADIVVGEGQGFGNYPSFGGPLLGIFATKKKFLRMMPGRLIGKTTSYESEQDAYCMTLQTREQHIRREKATSNICTNNAHCALTAAAYILTMGPKGFREIAEAVLGNTAFLISQLNSKIDVLRVPHFTGSHFGSFVITLPNSHDLTSLWPFLYENRIEIGPSLESVDQTLERSFLCSVSELMRREEMESLVSVLTEFLSSEKAEVI